MTLTIEFTPQDEAGLAVIAREEGIDLEAVVQKLVREHLPPAEAPLIAENDPLLALLKERIANAPTDPEAIRAGEEDLQEFLRNLDANRAATGERLLFP